MHLHIINDKNLVAQAAIAVVGHITEIYGPVQALNNYLMPNTRPYLFITHPFSYTSIPRSEALIFQDDKHRETIKCFKIIGPKIFHYLKDIIFTLWVCVFKIKHIGTYVGIDCLNAFTGLFLRLIGKVDKVVFYVIDYRPKWFEGRFLNFLYHLVDYICAKRSDQIWNLSPRMYEIRQRQKVNMENNMIVPVGIELNKIRPASLSEINRKAFIVVSHLVKSKGIELVLQVWPEIIKQDREAELFIIGNGPDEDELRRYAGSFGLDSNSIFIGHMEHDKLLDFMPACGIGLATYKEEANNFTWYADPTKPKEYLACGLPVIITKVPWIADEINNKMGIAINYKTDQLKNAMIRLLRDESFYWQCRENALKFAKKLDWSSIYDEAFRRCK